MGPVRTVSDGSSKITFRDRPLDARATAPEAEFYAKLSKLPKLYMVAPRDRQDNGSLERRFDGRNSACGESPTVSVRKFFHVDPVPLGSIMERALEIC